jgi:hypothetical protein
MIDVSKIIKELKIGSTFPKKYHIYLKDIKSIYVNIDHIKF